MILSRAFRDDISERTEKEFRSFLISGKTMNSPIVTVDNIIFCFVKVDTLFFTAVVYPQTNIMTTFAYLHQLPKLFESFIKTPITEKSIMANLILLQEIIDDTIDFGYQQATDKDTLGLLITQKGYKENVNANVQQTVSVQATGVISYRNPGIVYTHNRLNIHVIEAVSVTFVDGVPQCANVQGKVLANSRLSGMPTVRLGLTDKRIPGSNAVGSGEGRSGGIVSVDDARFHQSVQLKDYEGSSHCITFVPPDGKFQLMEYRISDQGSITLPLRVVPVITIQSALSMQIEVNATVLCSHKIDKLIIRVPVPSNTVTAHSSVGIGKAKFEPEKGMVVWRVRTMPGSSINSLRISLTLQRNAVDREEEGKTWKNRAPISVSFVITGYSASGFGIASSTVVEKSGYKADSYLKTTCVSGEYIVKI